MLKKFSVEGYRGFQDKLVFDLSMPRDYRFNTGAIRDGIVKDALIYGRNGTGKTNLSRALLDIRQNVVADSTDYRSYVAFLNADGNQSNALFSYLFELDGQDVLYEYAKGSKGIVTSEYLEIGGEIVFEVDGSGEWLHNNLDRYTSGSLVVEGRMQLPRSSVLGYVCANSLPSRLGPIWSLYRFILAMQLNNTAVSLERDVESVLDAGKADELELFLRSHGISERLEVRLDAAGNKVLYMSKRAHPIPFAHVCSSGTRALVRLFVIEEMGETRPSLLVLDEFDAHYHHDLAEMVLQSIIDDQEMQMVATTHNTDLFSNKILRPDCLFVLSEHGITAAVDATTRELREGHNLSRLYKAGEFDV